MIIVFGFSIAHAFVDRAFSLGVGYYSQNAFGKTTSSPNSVPSFLGAASYPLNLKVDWRVSLGWYFSPQASYTPMERSASGDSAKVTFLYLSLPLGQNFQSGVGAHWDWFLGPGYLQSTIKGAGGTTLLSNGTSTSSFAVPGEVVTVQTITFGGGGSYNFGSSRVGLDLIAEGLLSNKRTASFMLSYAQRFGGGRK